MVIQAKGDEVGWSVAMERTRVWIVGMGRSQHI